LLLQSDASASVLKNAEERRGRKTNKIFDVEVAVLVDTSQVPRISTEVHAFLRTLKLINTSSLVPLEQEEKRT
jgi:hypothetical protein